MIRSMVATGIACLFTATVFAAPVYKIEPIPGNLQFVPTGAIAINKKGEVIGDGETPDGQTILYKYSKGKAKRLPNDQDIYLRDLTDGGDVLGSRNVDSAYVIWHADGSREQFNPGPGTSLVALNSAIQVVGSASDELSHAAMYANGALTLLKIRKPYEASWAVDINDASAVLIDNNLLGGEGGREASILQNGKQTRIGLGLGENHWSFGVAINAKGHAIGTSDNKGFIYNGVKSKPLASLDGYEIKPISLNNLDEVVGRIDGHSTLTIGATSIRFESTLDATGAEWTDLYARGINDRGEIVGSGKYNGNYRAFIATRLSP